jgi:hypothetical protein
MRILVTPHEEDGSHEFEFTSLVGMRTSHVCALRTPGTYMPRCLRFPTFVMPYQVGNITFRRSNTERPLSFTVIASIRLLVAFSNA